MSNSPKVTEKTAVISDAVTFFTDKQIYEGWEDVQITREINTCALAFQLRLTDKWQQGKVDWRIQPGSHAHIHMGKQSVITGYVDAVEASFSSNSRSIVARGRSKTADLVDCSVTGANEYSNVTLKEIAEKVCAPFGIYVKFDVSPGDRFAKVTVKQGETVFELLDRLARQRKLIMIPDYDGGLTFTQKGTKRAGTELRQGANVLSGSASYDNSNRFSKYIVKGQNLSFLGSPDQSTSPSGEATDAGIIRFRPLVIVNNGTSDDKNTQDRASYEANIRAAKAIEAEVEVVGWFKQDGKLWDVNEIVQCDIGFLGIRREMLISKVVYQKNSGGTTTTLTLIREDAYDFTTKNKEKKEKELGWLKATGKNSTPTRKVSSAFDRQEGKQ